MRTRIASGIAALSLAAGLVVSVSPSAAAAPARCPSEPDKYKISGLTTSKQMSGLRSDYLRGPGTITYRKTRTATTRVSVHGQAKADLKIILAKASAKAGVKLGKSWSKRDTWEYSAHVSRGKEARLVMYHVSRRFYVKKYYFNEFDCEYQLSYRSRVNAPRKSNVNVWRLQYR